jgi:ABC-type uncharacterized transport system involved in gliding motility auxiliary subunit
MVAQESLFGCWSSRKCIYRQESWDLATRRTKKSNLQDYSRCTIHTQRTTHTDPQIRPVNQETSNYPISQPFQNTDNNQKARFQIPHRCQNEMQRRRQSNTADTKPATLMSCLAYQPSRNTTRKLTERVKGKACVLGQAEP